MSANILIVLAVLAACVVPWVPIWWKFGRRRRPLADTLTTISLPGQFPDPRSKWLRTPQPIYVVIDPGTPNAEIVQVTRQRGGLFELTRRGTA